MPSLPDRETVDARPSTALEDAARAGPIFLGWLPPAVAAVVGE